MRPSVWVCVRAAALLCAVTASGCATYVDRLAEIQRPFAAGDLGAAEKKIETLRKKHAREADVLDLERATVLLAQGKARAAEQAFRGVRDRFDHLEQKDLAEGAVSMLSDDQRLAYAGEEYERVLIRVFLTLSNLMGDGQDAGAYALQVTQKQEELLPPQEESAEATETKASPEAAPKKDRLRVAAGAYIYAALREETHQNYDDAAHAIERVCHWAPEFESGKTELDRVKTGRHSSPGNGVLYVFALTGRGPYKEERWEIPTQAAMLVADRIIAASTKTAITPTLAPIKVPRVVIPFNTVDSIGVAIDGAPSGQTQTLTDIGRLALFQAEAEFPEVLGRAVARRVVKKSIVAGAGKASENAGGPPAEVLAILGIAWEATESADTRCWGLLPEKIQVLRLELPAGEHEVALRALGKSNTPLGQTFTKKVTIADGRSTYVLANFPNSRLAGQISSSR